MRIFTENIPLLFLVLKLLAKMYGISNGSVPQQQQQMQQYQQQEQYNMYGMHGENSTIPGATSATSSPTMLQQPHHDLYGSNGGNLISSLRTHSSKFPVSARYKSLLTVWRPWGVEVEEKAFRAFLFLLMLAILCQFLSNLICYSCSSQAIPL